MTRKTQVKKASVKLILDPRKGDIEDDASSTKQRSMLSLFGSMLVEISLPKLILAWILLLMVPGLLLGLAPLVLTSWLGVVANKLTTAFIGIRSALSAPSPVMEVTDEKPTTFYIHTLAIGDGGQLQLLPPERIVVDGEPANAD
jgi:hypothetical protein